MENHIKNSIGSKKGPIYDCKIGSVKMESYRSDRFSIRQCELLKLKLSEVPYEPNLIVCDSNSHSEKVEIDLVIMVKKVEDKIFRFTFEETSQSGRWKSPETMEEYFYDQRTHVCRIQRESFKIVLMQDKFDFSSFLLRYGTDIPIESTERIINLANERMDKILEYCTKFNLSSTV